MSDRRYTLDEQIAAMAVVVKGFNSAVNGGEAYQDRLIEYHAGALSAALDTLRILRIYDDDVRAAIRAARERDVAREDELDAAAER